MADRAFFRDRVSSVATGRKRLAEHLIAKGMLSPEDVPVTLSKASNAPKGTAANAGWRVVGEQRIYARSSWEANFSRYLEWMRVQRGISSWSHEKAEYWFEKIKRGVRSYKPDFEVIELNGSATTYEVKGHFDARSKTKLKRLRKYYPNVRIVLVGRKSHEKIAADLGVEFMSYRGIAKQLGGLIGGWE
jgi:hypothetical protein